MLLGAPLFPEGDPWTWLSPGNTTSIRLAVPALMVMLEEVLAVPAPEAVKVWAPAVTSAALKLVVPEASGRFPGGVAAISVVTPFTVEGSLEAVTVAYRAQ